MPKVRTGSAEKWSRRTAQATADYVAGIQNPRADWAAQTTNAEPNYQSGVQQAIAAKRFSGGVRRRGTAGWQAKSLSKGADRYAGGATASTQDYQERVQPYLDVISSLTLPPRGPKGDPKNYARVEAIGKALRAKKLALSGSPS